jgi:hypothetical protein
MLLRESKIPFTDSSIPQSIGIATKEVLDASAQKRRKQNKQLINSNTY